MTKRWWSAVAAVITLAAAARLLLSTVADPDLWGHIRFGQRTLSGGLERIDPFSYLSGPHDWINHELLSEVVFAIVFDAAGGVGLIALKSLIGLLVVGLIYRHLIGRGSDPLRAGLLLLPTMLLLVPGLATVRPQMFTFLFFTLVVLVLHRVEDGHEASLWWVPPILAIWINFHGGVLAGAGVLGLWGMARVVAAAREPTIRAFLTRIRFPLGVGILCALATLANPYGVGLPEFLLRTATVPRPDIVDWQPLSVRSAPGLVYLALTGLASWTLLRAPGRLSAPLLTVLVVLVVLPLTAVRHLQLFAIGVPVLIADAFAVAWRRETPPREAGAPERLVVVGTTVLAAGILLITGLRDARCIEIDPVRSIGFPARAVTWLADSGVEGDVATFFDWGQYALWHLGPEIRVSMDGRRETVYSDSVYAEYLRFQNGVGSWRDLLARDETDMVLFPKGYPGYNLTALDPEWLQVYDDSIAGVFVRAGRPQLATLQTVPHPELPADGAGLCVPVERRNR
ncbi:MAG: hypothetical protein MJB57_17075 [Gemmatimonadetes bacterium]|nr:hypothetical protein [Gemmatimonadota bacterium]